MNARRIFHLLLLLVYTLSMYAQRADSIRVSLITCSPGHEVYSLYGHTAIRCENLHTGADVVFNYGVFSFDQPNFIWRFVLGECDYMVVPVPWKYFWPEYSERGSGITAQVLNLNSREAGKLFDMLAANCLPENRMYRYNFLYNNCTTMVRDMVERCVEGHVVYADTIPHYTYREILHQYTSVQPWAQEGDDLLLGSDVDTLLTPKAAMFAPEYMMRYASSAVIRNDNNDTRPLVLETETLLQKRNVTIPDVFPLAPVPTFLCLLAFCLLVMGLERLINRQIWIWDVLLLLAQGLAGSLLLFMFLFSQHPGVGSNWLIGLLHPVALLGIPIVVKAAYRKRKTLWHPLNLTILALFLVFSSWIPQDFGNIVVPLALALMTRPISYYLYYRKNEL